MPNVCGTHCTTGVPVVDTRGGNDIPHRGGAGVLQRHRPVPGTGGAWYKHLCKAILWAFGRPPFDPLREVAHCWLDGASMASFDKSSTVSFDSTALLIGPARPPFDV